MSILRRLLFIVLILTSTQAFSLAGDWGSSGDQPRIHKPTYDYLYRCVAEISDRKSYTLEGRTGEVFAVANFELGKDRTYVANKDLQWKTVMLSEGDELTLSSPIPFKLNPLSIALNLGHGSGRTADDEGTLSASVALDFGQEYVSDSEQSPFTRRDSETSLKVSIFSSVPEDYKKGRTRQMYVGCEKIR